MRSKEKQAGVERENQPTMTAILSLLDVLDDAGAIVGRSARPGPCFEAGTPPSPVPGKRIRNTTLDTPQTRQRIRGARTGYSVRCECVQPA